jgi:CubicO group peptidase (beta-lactamase class C family)
MDRDRLQSHAQSAVRLLGLLDMRTPSSRESASSRHHGRQEARDLILRLVALSLAAASVASAQVANVPLDRVDEFVRAELERQRVPGVAVAIVSKGELLAAKGYGYSNVEHKVPVIAETIFQSGSLGKQFTSALVMTLVEEGKLGLEDPITRFFPDAPDSWRGIRVRHLLTHTSGIPDYTEQDIDFRRDYTEDDLTEVIYRLTPEFAPGSRWNYSNTGYVLLGILVHKVSGRFYGDLLKERIFTPLGMKTARIITEEDIVPNRAAGYRLVKGELKNQEWVAPMINTTADGSLYLTVLDMVAWDRGLRAKAILKPDSWTRIFSPVTLNSGKTYPYGFGWSVTDQGGQATQQHGGAWQGFQTYIARYVGDDLTIIVFANLAGANTGRFVEGIAAVFNPRLARAEPTPIADTEPAVAARLRVVLQAAALGVLSKTDFAYVRAGFFPDAANRYREVLRELGPPQTLELLERQELGDDRIYLYQATFGIRTFIVQFGLAPDNRISLFSVRNSER